MSSQSHPLPGAGIGVPARERGAARAKAAPQAKAKSMTVASMAIMTAATVVTSLRGLPMMAEEELTMFAYIGFAVVLFLIPAALVSAELGGAYPGKNGVYTWVGEAFGQRYGFLAVWLQWIQNVVWNPTGLAFAAAAVAFAVNDQDLASNNTFVGLFCIAAYWVAILIALSGTDLLIKVTNYGFIIGTIVPGVLLLGFFGYWLAKGFDLGWDTAKAGAVTTTDTAGHHHPRWFPHYGGLGTLSFLAGILLLFAGVEVQAVNANKMDDPKTGFPKAMILAAVISAGIFTIGALAVAGILDYDDISLQTGVFDAFDRVLEETGGSTFILPIIAAAIGYGAIAGPLAWIGGPSRGLLATAKDGALPPILQGTNSKGIQRNILILQGIIVTAISSIYLLMDDVDSAFFLISAMTISLYIVMYLILYAAAIKLRYTRPDLPRTFMIPGGKAGLWLVAGVGFAAVAFALVLSFAPPDQLPIGNSTTYVLLVAAGLVVFTALPMIIQARRKANWIPADEHPLHDEVPATS